MKYRSVLSSFCKLMIGFASVSAMVSSSQAADIGMPTLAKGSVSTMAMQPQMNASSEQVPRYLTGDSRSIKGAQGPIRTDYLNQTSSANAEALRLDLQMNRYPMNNSVSIP